MTKLKELIGNETIHPLVFYSGKIAGYITWIVLILAIFNIKISSHFTFTYLLIIANIFLSVALVLIILSLIQLGKSVRLGLPIEETSLKISGLYQISRNPMYVGFDMLTFSSILYTQNFWMLLLGIYSIVVYHFIILGEENFLEKRFGSVYSQYKKKVRRYL